MTESRRMFISRFASDIIAGVISLVFAAWNMIGRDFAKAPSMAFIGQRWTGAEFLFGAVSIAASLCLFYGTGDRRFWRVAGFILGFAVFTSCFVSTLMTLPSDPAAPVFLGMGFGYIWQASLITLRIR